MSYLVNRFLLFNCFKLELLISLMVWNQLLARIFLSEPLPLHPLGRPIVFHLEFRQRLEDLRICVAGWKPYEWAHSDPFGVRSTSFSGSSTFGRSAVLSRSRSLGILRLPLSELLQADADWGWDSWRSADTSN